MRLPSYYGDAVNSLAFTPEARRPDAQRLVETYHASAAALNLVRAFTQGGYADLRHVHTWNQDFVRETPAGRRYESMAGEIDRALGFMKACGADPEEFHRVDFYSGHEGAVAGLRAGADADRFPHRSCRTTCPRTSCGSASGPGSSTGRTWTSPPGSTIRSA